MNKFWSSYNAILLAIILTFLILYFARPVFMPLALAAMLALLFMRPCQWLENKGVPRLLTAIGSAGVFIVLVAGVVLLVNWYIRRFATNLPQLQLRLSSFITHSRQFLREEWGIRIPGGTGLSSLLSSIDTGKMTTSVLASITAVIIHLILIVVYMVMLLCTRTHIKLFFLKLMRPENRPSTRMVLGRCGKIVQEYLYGLMIIIACLWVMYGLAFSFIGVRYALFFAILCGVLEIIPFVGNMTGSTLTCLMALSQGGGLSMVAAVIGSYLVIQFIQFYIIYPLIVRRQINLNPLFTILSLIAGDLLWGIPGMILSIPFIGIFKVVCDEVEFLQPFGFLLGRSPKSITHRKQSDLKATIAKWLRRTH